MGKELTAENVVRAMKKTGMMADIYNYSLVKMYAINVAKQALKDAADSCSETEDKRGEHASMIREIEIITP